MGPSVLGIQQNGLKSVRPGAIEIIGAIVAHEQDFSGCNSHLFAQGRKELTRRFAPADFRTDHELLQGAKSGYAGDDGPKAVIVVRGHAQDATALGESLEEEARRRITRPCMGLGEVREEFLKAALTIVDIVQHVVHDVPPAKDLAFFAGSIAMIPIERFFSGERGPKSIMDFRHRVPTAELSSDSSVDDCCTRGRVYQCPDRIEDHGANGTRGRHPA